MGGDRAAAFRERAWLRAPCPPKPWRRSMARSTRPRLFAGARPFRRKAIVAGSTLRHVKFLTFPHLLPGIALERGSEFRYTAGRSEPISKEPAPELARRGVAPDQRVVVAIEPDDWISEARRASRAKVVAAGLSDDDIDRLIKQAQKEVEPGLR